jgi:hypothetical protein
VVNKVLFTVISDTALGMRLPMRVQYPFENDLSAAPDSTSLWVLNLADSARADSLHVLPRLAGFRATVIAPMRAALRGTACVARIGYQLTRVWRVEVSSKPENLKVEERPASGSANAQTRYTRFESELLWGDRLSIRLFLKDNKTYEEIFDRPLASAPLVRTSHDIADRLCRLEDCNRFVRAAQGKLVEKSVEQLSIRLVPP